MMVSANIVALVRVVRDNWCTLCYLVLLKKHIFVIPHYMNRLVIYLFSLRTYLERSDVAE